MASNGFDPASLPMTPLPTPAWGPYGQWEANNSVCVAAFSTSPQIKTLMLCWVRCSLPLSLLHVDLLCTFQTRISHNIHSICCRAWTAVDSHSTL